MFSKRTLFIVGAGESYELGLPLGAQLKHDISKRLVTQILGQREFELPEDDEFYRFAYGQTVPQIDTWMVHSEYPLVQKRLASWAQIRNGIHFASSIDNYLHNRRSEEDLIRVGKAAICWEIARCEAKLPVPDDRRPFETFDPGSWLNQKKSKPDEQPKTI